MPPRQSSEKTHDDGTVSNVATKDRTLHGAMSGSGSTYQEALIGLASGVVFGAVSPVVGHP